MWPSVVRCGLRYFSLAEKMQTAGFKALLAFKYLLLLEDIFLNAFTNLFNYSNISLMVMNVIQLACLVLAIITLFISFFSTYICQAGLMSVLARKFAFTITSLFIYFALTIGLYSWELYWRWPNNQAFVWSTGYCALYGIQRCFAVFYYYFYKRTALRLADGHFHEEAEWMRQEFNKRR